MSYFVDLRDWSGTEKAVEEGTERGKECSEAMFESLAHLVWTNPSCPGPGTFKPPTYRLVSLSLISTCVCCSRDEDPGSAPERQSRPQPHAFARPLLAMDANVRLTATFRRVLRGRSQGPWCVVALSLRRSQTDSLSHGASSGQNTSTRRSTSNEPTSRRRWLYALRLILDPNTGACH